ncbi:MAG: hypothetical protein H7Z14_11655 [Anaerolineae bacterium]|nr:hypothetical protein [Phycisphaerae bacterium]
MRCIAFRSGTEISTDTSPTSAAPESEVRCIKCGYDIRGIDDAAVCPECGTAIAFSTRFGRLDHADPLFVRTCAIGVTLLVVAACGTVLTWALYLLRYYFLDLPADTWSITMSNVSIGLEFLEPVALWLLLAPEKCGEVRIKRTPWPTILRWVAVACALRFTGILFAVFTGYRTSQFIHGGMAVVVAVLIYIRLRDLATRADPRLATQASVVMAATIAGVLFMYFIPALATVPQLPMLLSVVLGPGVAILSAVVWWKFRRMLISAAEQARDNWPGRSNGAREAETAAMVEILRR